MFEVIEKKRELLIFYFSLPLSEESSSFSDIQGKSLVWISVSSDEILEDEFRILEIWLFVVVGLSVDSGESFLEVFVPPDESLEVYWECGEVLSYLEVNIRSNCDCDCVFFILPSCWKRYSFWSTNSLALSETYSSNNWTLVNWVL